MLPTHLPHATRRLGPALLLGALLLLLLLACGGTALLPQTRTTAETPSWACPSPTPKPSGASGPVKEWEECDCHTDPVTGKRSCDDCPVYYEQWEQEYGALGGPPFPSPTPYVVVGTTYSLGQRVRIPPLYAMVTAQAGGAQPDGRMLYSVDIAWTNPLSTSVAIDYGAQVLISAIATPDGRTITGERWGLSRAALELTHAELPTSVPPGESRVRVPILAPAGEVQTLDLRVRRDLSYAPTGPTATPTPAGAGANQELRGAGDDQVVVQFVRARPAGPRCDSPGATTAWDSAGPGVNGVADAPVAAPSGASRVVQLALQQVGRPYVWGATGPGAFDCSGLMVWSYAQVGLRLPYRVSRDQFARMTPVAAAQLQAGDLVYFAIAGGGIDHVGMLVGDLNQDGEWDMVHAASPRLGVRAEYNIFCSAYYAPRIRGFRTLR